MPQYASGFTPDPPPQKSYAEGFTPDTTTPAQARIAQGQKALAQVAMDRAKAAGVPDARTAGEVALDQMSNVAKGVGGSITGIPAAIGGIGSMVGNQLFGDKQKAQQQLIDMVKGLAQPATTAIKGALSGQSVMVPAGAGATTKQLPEYPEGNPTNPAWAQAAQGSGNILGGTLTGIGAGAALKAAANALPSTARAGAAFNAIASKANPIVLDTATEVDPIVARAQELSSRGNVPVKVITDFLKEQAKGPITYQAGRDFASKAGSLSAEEAAQISKTPMQAQVAKFADAMDNANRGAAVKAGMGDVYDAAMKEYAQAKSIQEKVAIIKKYGPPAAITALIGAAAAKHYGLLGKLLP